MPVARPVTGRAARRLFLAGAVPRPPVMPGTTAAGAVRRRAALLLAACLLASTASVGVQLVGAQPTAPDTAAGAPAASPAVSPAAATPADPAAAAPAAALDTLPAAPGAALDSLSAASAVPGAETPTVAAPAEQPLDPAAELLRARIEELRENGRLNVRGAWIASRAVLPALYEGNGFQRLWDTERAEQLLRGIREAETDGLDPRDYHASALELLERAARNGSVPPSTLLVDRDLVLTDAFVLLWSHLRFGKLEAKADTLPPRPRWDLRRAIDGREPAEALREMLRAASGPPPAAGAPGLGGIERLLLSARPQHPLYAGLRSALIEHRGLAAAGGWPAWAPGARLDPGGRDARAPRLRRRLGLPADTSLVYDAALETAVRDFQRRHGLPVDGILGPRTQAALAVPAAARVEQLRANLERARWLLRDLDGRFLLVNIPDQSVELIEDGRVAWRSLAAVGKPLRQTPSLRARLTYLVFNPTWTVPEVILEREIIPGMRADRTTLAQRHLRLIDRDGREVPADAVDWASADARRFPYLARMDPGPENPLGRVKFMLPNDHQVYLHDTPSKALFDRSRRAASSGCIRLEDPLGLAERLLAGQAVPSLPRANGEDDASLAACTSASPVWTRAVIDCVVLAGETTTVPLRRPLPVVVLYLTAWRDEEGTVQFRDDLYGRDAPLLEALGLRHTAGD